jgi:phosphoribosylformimino-5-aminoimidazole carboxamide ribotide isomerase
MDLYPAIDIRHGRAVRLTRGDFARQDEYGDPIDLALQFVAGGARWLHVVDLDAARTGQPVNRSTVLAIATTAGVPVQVGGGVRSEADVDQLLSGGVSRVVFGTVAVDRPTAVRRLAARYPGRVAVGIDYRRDGAGRTEVASRGWEQGSGRTVADLLGEYEEAGMAAVVVTAIDRDGTLTGPDLSGLTDVLASTDIPVIASGGVASAADIGALADLAVVPVGPDAAQAGVPRRLSGVITGKALVDGRMTVEEGLAACALSG